MIERIGIIFRKEVMDNLRDRRTLAGSLFYPLLGPGLVVLLLTVLGRNVSDRAEQPLPLPVSGREHAPALVQFLEQNGADIEDAPADAEAQVRAGNLDIVLVIPPDYAEEASAGRPAPVQLIVDRSRQSASLSRERIGQLLEGYSSQLHALRLLARGINPAAVEPLAVETVDLATPQSQAAELLNLTPYFIIFSIFIGGMYLAIDSTAGERERGSLEPLLINPVSRAEVVLGKLAATLLFTMVAVIETLVGFAIVLNVLPLDEFFGTRFSLDSLTLVMIFLISLPIMLLASTLQILVATYTRSFKEAQNYLSFLPLIPALPGMFLAFIPVRPELWTMLIPTFGQQLLINQLMRGEMPSTVNVAVSFGMTTLVALLLVWVTIRLYQGERVLFGR